MKKENKMKKYKNILDILLSFFEEYLITNNITYTTVGNTLVAAIDSIRNLNIKLKFSHTVGHYDSVVFELKNKKSGEIDTNHVLFRDVFDSYGDLTHPNKLPKYIENLEWYGKPTNKDISQLVKELDKYLTIWT